MFEVPEGKRVKVLGHICKARSSQCSTAKLFAQLVGYLVSLRCAIGPVAYIKTRFLQMAIRDAPAWNLVFPIGDEVKTELRFWESYLSRVAL